MKIRIMFSTVLIIGLFTLVQAGYCQTSTTSEAPTQTSSSTQVEPEITQEEAHQQAEASTPDPQQVFDITNSGIVYGILKDGVAAWIASLDGSRDQWGNEVSTVYVTASRPDVVPASLQTFLLSFYKDNPTIGLAYGPEGVKEAESTLEDAYQEAVDEKAESLYQDAVDKAEEEQAALEQQQQEEEENNDSEDVPPLDDDNDNGDDNPDDDEEPVDDDDEEPVTAATISSISPSDFELGSSQQTLDIVGENFGTEASEVTVDFSNGYTGIVPDSVTETSIKVKVPSDFVAGTDITVTVNKGETTTSGVLITARPSIASISPTTLRDNESLIIKGYGFDTNTSGNNVIYFEALDSETNGNVDFHRTATSAEFLSTSNQSQLSIKIPISAETVGDYTVTVKVSELDASGSETITFSE
jgi:hypothetical protein